MIREEKTRKTAEAQSIFVESWCGHPSNLPGNELPPLDGGVGQGFGYGGSHGRRQRGTAFDDKDNNNEKKMQCAVQVISLVLAWTNACCTSLTTFRT